MSSPPFEYIMNNAFLAYCGKRALTDHAYCNFQDEECHYVTEVSLRRRQIRALRETNHLAFHQNHIMDMIKDFLEIDDTSMMEAKKIYENAKVIEQHAYDAYRGVVIVSTPNPFDWLS